MRAVGGIGENCVRTIDDFLKLFARTFCGLLVFENQGQRWRPAFLLKNKTRTMGISNEGVLNVSNFPSWHRLDPPFRSRILANRYATVSACELPAPDRMRDAY